jgi:beta-lactamase class A
MATPVAKRTADYVERPLAELSKSAAEFLDGREGPRGAAVVVPSRGTIYTYNGDELTPMASVAKVTIMVTVMDKAVREKRALTEWEMQMLRPMITVSDNDSATALWEYVGGGAAVEATLQAMGLTATKPNPMEAWGASRSTPRETALLFTKLALGEILDEERRTLALELLGAVIPDQTWGVLAGVPTDQPERAVIAIKDGWNPTQGGWWVNSAGLVLPLIDRPAYAMAVLTRQQPTMEYGIATIEGVASRVHAALHALPTPTATR